jgi:GNAT superfamily N-acetyltransferase
LIQPLSSANPKLHLRFAAEEDTPLILGFIKELAAYEKLSHEVVADESALKKTLFNGRKVAEVILAEFAGEPVGFALFFHTYSTFLGKPGLYLEDLYVRPHLRGKGIGRELLACLARIAVERDCGRLEWWVLDWNDPAIKFYRGLGGEAMDEWTVFRVDGSALQELANANRSADGP